jgi:hypothetical protein
MKVMKIGIQDLAMMKKKRRNMSMTATIASNDTALGIVNNLKALKVQMKELQKYEEELKQKLYNFMGEHDVLINHETGEESVRWTYSEGYQKFDVKKFMADKPRVYKQYLFMTDPVRTLRVAK